MASVLPPIPRLIFSVFEPLSLVGGFIYPLILPHAFIADQVLFDPPVVYKPLTPNEHLVGLQLGNIYLLMAFIGIAVLYSTNDVRLVKRYIFALLLGDVGHLAVTYHILGHEKYLDVKNWNSLAWGNIGVTAFLLLTRTAYLLGLLGVSSKTTTGAGRKASIKSKEK
jgi:hypothetical protein